MTQLISIHQTKSTRLETRAKPEVKKRLEFAAALLGSSLSKFILMSAEELADKVISKHQVLKLNKDDSLALLKNIKSPDKANSVLKTAFQDYRRDVSSDL